MSLDEFTAPECQLSDCEAGADTTREHPRFGDVQVCRTCARMFDAGGEQ